MSVNNCLANSESNDIDPKRDRKISAVISFGDKICSDLRKTEEDK